MLTAHDLAELDQSDFLPMLTYHSVSGNALLQVAPTTFFKLASERVRADYWMQYLKCTEYKMFIYYLNVYIIIYYILFTLYMHLMYI